MVTNFKNSLEFKKCLQNKKHADFKTIHKIEKLKQKNREPEFFPRNSKNVHRYDKYSHFKKCCKFKKITM